MTLKDIAQEVGVSISTVSRVLNGNSPQAASKIVQEKIWEAARKGGYVPNASAQALKNNGRVKQLPTKAIACLYGRITESKNDAFFSALTRSIEQEALKEGYILKYSFSAFDVHNPNTHQLIASNEVDGVVILGRCDEKLNAFVNKHFKKIIYTGLNAVEASYDQVICDGYQIAYDAVKYLAELGHEHIGYIGEIRNEVRYKGYSEALTKLRLPILQERTANVAISSEGGYEGAKRILNRTKKVTALFCMNDITAIGAIKAVQESGLKVPQDISVISIDDIEIAQYISPMLTTYHIPIEEMGKMTIKILIDRIKGGHKLPLKLSLPYTLAKRESCKKIK